MLKWKDIDEPKEDATYIPFPILLTPITVLYRRAEAPSRIRNDIILFKKKKVSVEYQTRRT